MTADFRAEAKHIKRTQAAAGQFDFALEFRELCLSEQGYSPSGCLACLAIYANSVPAACDMILIAERERPFWESSMRAVDPTEAERTGTRLVVNVEPWATDGERVLAFAVHIGRLIRKATQDPFSVQRLKL